MQLVYLHSPPRSGSTWLQMVFEAHPAVRTRYQPFFSYDFKGELKHDMSQKEFADLVDRINRSDNDFISMKADYHQGDFPVYPKGDLTHLLLKQTHYHNYMATLLTLEPTSKMICLLRHPCGTINSVLKTSRECKGDWRMTDEWMTGARKNDGKDENYFGYQKWIEFAHDALVLKKAFPDRVLIVMYEDFFGKCAKDTILKLFDFVALPLADTVWKFVEDSSTKHDTSSTGVHKNPSVVRAWKTELDPEIISYIQKDVIERPISLYLRDLFVFSSTEAQTLSIAWPDVYYTPAYGQLLESKQMRWECAIHPSRSVLYVYYVRHDDEKASEVLETPYGYAGYWVGPFGNLVDFRQSFRKVARDRGYTEAFCRLNPYLLDTSLFSEATYSRKTYGISLTTYDAFFKEIGGKARNMVRKGEREGATFVIQPFCSPVNIYLIALSF